MHGIIVLNILLKTVCKKVVGWNGNILNITMNKTLQTSLKLANIQYVKLGCPCHVFSVKIVQNLRTFWRTTQNLLILALLCSLYNQQTF